MSAMWNIVKSGDSTKRYLQLALVVYYLYTFATSFFIFLEYSPPNFSLILCQNTYGFGYMTLSYCLHHCGELL